VTARDKADRRSARDGVVRRQPEEIAIVLGGRHPAPASRPSPSR
jgi:hypothetical protein